jgi:hypothetical protein
MHLGSRFVANTAYSSRQGPRISIAHPQSIRGVARLVSGGQVYSLPGQNLEHVVYLLYVAC